MDAAKPIRSVCRHAGGPRPRSIASRAARRPPQRRPYPWNLGRTDRLPQHLSQAQTQALLAAAAGNVRDRLVLNLMYRYALRPGEVGRLLLADLDLARRTIRIPRLKRGLAGEFPLFAALVPLVEAWLAARRLPTGSGEPPLDQDVLFPSRQRRRHDGRWVMAGLTAKRVHQLVCRTGRAAGLPRHLVRGHTLRHTAATHLLDAGWGLEDIRVFLGHRCLDSTLIYAQVSARRWAARFALLEGSDAIVGP